MGSRSALDVKKLSEELATAAVMDKRRKDVDDMKKRSILTAGSYDEFRHLVACAKDDQKAVSSKEMAKFGKPLEKKAFAGGYSRRGQRDDRTRATGRGRRRGNRKVVAEKPAGIASPAEEGPPATLGDFERRWRRCGTDRAAQSVIVLSMSEEDTISKVFRIGVDDYLGGIVQALADPACRGSESAAASVLRALSQTPRFDLSLKFLSSDEKGACASLINSLQKAGVGDIDALRATYCS